MKHKKFPLSDNKSRVDELREQLEAAEEKLRELDRKQLSGADINPGMEIGGIRSRSKRQKGRIIDRLTREAHEYAKLKKHVENLRRQLKIEEERPAREEKRRIENIKWAMKWINIKPGDKILVGASHITVKKKNKKSITATSGTNWSRFEIIGMSDAEFAAAVAEIEKTKSDKS